MNLADIKISQLIKIMESNEISSEEITKNCISNIEKEGLDSASYETLLKDEVISKAREIDKKRKSKESLGVLAGIPFVVTDDISTKGVLTTAGSKILENYIPPFNATIMDRVLEEDSLILGKLKVSEFGLEATNNVSKTLDSRGAIFGLSTSMEANKISMKPTYGLISRYGVIGATSTFSQIVAITNCVEDMGTVLNSIVGYDKKDSTSIPRDKVDYRESLTSNIRGLNIAIPTELFTKDYGVQIDKIVEELESLGVIVKEVSLSTLDYVLPVYNILSSAEFVSNSVRYDGISLGYRTKEYTSREELYKKTRAEGFGKEAKKRILFGNYVISSGQYEKQYKKAQKIRTMIKEELTAITNEYGLLMLPFTSNGYDDGVNLVGNMTGLPSITVPYGIQFLGSNFKEKELLQLAYIYEKMIGKATKEVGNND